MMRNLRKNRNVRHNTTEYTDNQKAFILLTGNLPQKAQGGASIKTTVQGDNPFNRDDKLLVQSLLRAEASCQYGRRKSNKTKIGFDENDSEVRSCKAKYMLRVKLLARKLEKMYYPNEMKKCIKIAKRMRKGEPVDGWSVENGEYFKII